MKRQTMFLAASFFLTMLIALPGWAESFEDEEIVHHHLHKLSRGVINIFTSPLEVPKQMIRQAQKEESSAGQAAGYLTGTVTGIGWMLWRCTSGVVDILSTPFCGNTDGLIQPEFI
ncbi:MAG TPA: exosortase system-associated protein, TIGR04073 family, partial [Thermodesulfobacteriota bacterium]|nr:exosortase system-associated protein, TIGR04073 family [Thermodesulfobacteriota bacterium]